MRLVIFMALLALAGCKSVETPAPRKQDISFYTMPGVATEDVANLQAGSLRMNEVLHTPCFAQKMHDTPIIESFGRTSDQVVAELRALKANIKVEPYNNPKEFTYAWGFNGVFLIYTNSYFFNPLTVCGKASILLHEVTHTVGYPHNSVPLAHRTVPYAVQSAVVACCK